MKVYILIDNNPYDGPATIFGAFSSRENAIEAIRFHPDSLDPENDIEELEIDPSNEGEPYVSIPYCNIFESGEIGHYIAKIRLSKIPPPTLGGSWMPNCAYGSKRNFCAVAYGNTKEEAEIKAREIFKEIKPVWAVGRSGSDMYEVLFPHISCIVPYNRVAIAHHEDLNTARIIFWDYEKNGTIHPNLKLASKINA